MANERKRNYVGIGPMGRTLLRMPDSAPLLKTEKKNDLIGPFRSRRGALYAKNHPEVTTVAEAEKLAKQNTQKQSAKQKFFAGVRKLMQQCGVSEIKVVGEEPGEEVMAVVWVCDKDGNEMFQFNHITLQRE